MATDRRPEDIENREEKAVWQQVAKVPPPDLNEIRIEEFQDQHLRLNFAYQPEAEIEEGIWRLGRVQISF